MYYLPSTEYIGPDIDFSTNIYYRYVCMCHFASDAGKRNFVYEGCFIVNLPSQIYFTNFQDFLIKLLTSPLLNIICLYAPIIMDIVQNINSRSK